MKQETERILPLKEVQRLTGEPSRSTIWRWCRQKPPLFPRPRKIGPNRIGWLSSEIERWVKEKATS